MEQKAEIIEFCQPLGNGKNLFVTNIVTKYSEVEGKVWFELHEAFSKFGLLYEIQVLQSRARTQSHRDCLLNPECTSNLLGGARNDKLKVNEDKTSIPESGTDAINDCEGRYLWYAFVKFYSAVSALKAKQALHLTLIAGSEICKVNFAKRKKALKQENEKLFVKQCHDLANFYLGFNGWSSSVRVLKRESPKPVVPGSVAKCRFLCLVDLTIHINDVQTSGFGMSEEMNMLQDDCHIGSVFARCRKQAYSNALQKAFSSVLLVVLANGKVFPQINKDKHHIPRGSAEADIFNLSCDPRSKRKLSDDDIPEDFISEMSDGQQQPQQYGIQTFQMANTNSMGLKSMQCNHS